MAYPTADEVRANVRTLSDDTKYPDELIESTVDEFADVAERYRGVAFTTRSTSETVQFIAGSLQLRPKVQSITTITIDGTAQSGYQSDLETGRVWWLYPSWRTPFATVDYVHGYTETPNAVTTACYQFVRATLLADQSTVDRDVIRVNADGIVSQYSSPDWNRGRPTGWLDVDRRLNSLPDYRQMRMYR